jgi:hypothetical protein
VNNPWHVALSDHHMTAVGLEHPGPDSNNLLLSPKSFEDVYKSLTTEEAPIAAWGTVDDDIAELLITISSGWEFPEAHKIATMENVGEQAALVERLMASLKASRHLFEGIEVDIDLGALYAELANTFRRRHAFAFEDLESNVHEVLGGMIKRGIERRDFAERELTIHFQDEWQRYCLLPQPVEEKDLKYHEKDIPRAKLWRHLMESTSGGDREAHVHRQIRTLVQEMHVSRRPKDMGTLTLDWIEESLKGALAARYLGLCYQDTLIARWNRFADINVPR